jgi:hypothetical protein
MWHFHVQINFNVVASLVCKGMSVSFPWPLSMKWADQRQLFPRGAHRSLVTVLSGFFLLIFTLSKSYLFNLENGETKTSLPWFCLALHKIHLSCHLFLYMMTTLSPAMQFGDIKPCYTIRRHQAMLHNTATSSHATQYGDVKPCCVTWRHQALLCNKATSSPAMQ